MVRWCGNGSVRAGVRWWRARVVAEGTAAANGRDRVACSDVFAGVGFVVPVCVGGGIGVKAPQRVCVRYRGSGDQWKAFAVLL